MKTHLILLFSLALLNIVSCKKSPALQVTHDLLENQWKVKTITITQHRAGMEDKMIVVQGMDGDYFDFRKEGKLYTSLQNGTVKDTVYFSYIADDQISLNGNRLALINTLNSTNLNFNIKDMLNSTDYNFTNYDLVR